MGRVQNVLTSLKYPANLRPIQIPKTEGGRKQDLLDIPSFRPSSQCYPFSEAKRKQLYVFSTSTSFQEKVLENKNHHFLGDKAMAGLLPIVLSNRGYLTSYRTYGLPKPQLVHRIIKPNQTKCVNR